MNYSSISIFFTLSEEARQSDVFRFLYFIHFGIENIHLILLLLGHHYRGLIVGIFSGILLRHISYELRIYFGVFLTLFVDFTWRFVF